MRFSWLVTAGVCAWLVACGSGNHKKALMCDASECGPDLDAGASGIGEGGAPGAEKDAGMDAQPDAGAPPDEPDSGMPQAGESGAGDGELSLEIAGNGTIAVTDAAACLTSPCSYPASAGTVFALQAKPGADSRFVGWSGDCTGTKLGTSVTVNGATHCVATFVALRAVAAAVSAAGGGSVTSKPDLSCNDDGCKGEVDNHSTVTLTATADPGFGFVQWTGSPECQGKTQASITIEITQDLACNAVFAKQFTVSVSAAGASAPVGVATGKCDALSCVAAAGAMASFHAPIVPGYRFTGWSGDTLCTGTVNPLLIDSVASDIACVANYAARLTATGVVGGGLGGAVEASSGDVNATCLGNSCTLDAGTTATLKAPTIAGYALTSWSGAGCLAANQSGSGITVTPSNANVTCTANYTPGLSVSGTVVGATGTVNATSTSTTATCSAGICSKVSPGDSVTLTAPTLLPTYRFTGWSGDAGCAGGTAQITLTNVTTSKSCAASYVQQFTIASLAGAGGTVSAKNGATACGGNSCTVDAGTGVALGAVADTANGYHFVTWSGAGCTPAASNPLTLANVNATCTASFALDTFTIAATAGTNGSVSATRGDTNQQCAGNSCTVNYGVNVSLAAAPAANYHFNGWAGAGCAPTGSTPLSLKSLNATCAAAFAINTFTASVSAAPAGSGTVGITCPGNACGAVPYGQLVNVTAAANTGWSFAGWSANCGGGTASPNPVTITTNTACVATFRPIATAVTSPSGSGTITATGTANPVCSNGDPAKCTVDSGGSTTFVVKAGANAVFTGWSGDCTGTSTTATLSAITAPKNCIANFYRLWAMSTGTKGDESMTHVTALADGTVVGLGVTVPVGSKVQNLSLVDLDANSGKLTQALEFIDAAGTASFSALGLTTDAAQKNVIALAQHAGVKQPYLYDRNAKWDFEYKYSGGGAALAQGGEVITTLDGGIAFCLGILDPTNPQGIPSITAGHLTKVDATGKPVFDVQFCAKDSKGMACLPTLPVDLLQDPATKNYVVLSQVLTPAYALMLTFISEAGAVLASTTYIDSQDLTAAQFVTGAVADSYLVVGTRTDAKGSSNAFFGEFNRTAGTPRFVYQVNTDTADKHLFSVAKTSNGYAMAGLFNDAKELNEAWLVLIDNNGAIKSQLAYGGPLGDRANAISNVPAGGFVLGGATLNWTQGNADMWTLRLDPAGAITFDTTLATKPLSYATTFAATAVGTAVRPGGLPFGVTDSSATQVKATVKTGAVTYGQIAETP